DAQGMNFPNFLQKIIQETGLLAKVIEAGDSLERLNSIQSFHEYVTAASHARGRFFLRDFIEHLDTVKKHGISTRRRYNEHIRGVRLMTAHRAKGLEFNNVFILHAVHGVWGDRHAR